MTEENHQLKLMRALQLAGVRPSAYSMAGAKDLALCLDVSNEQCQVYFFEKGEKHVLQQFIRESDACAFMYHALIGDKTSFM